MADAGEKKWRPKGANGNGGAHYRADRGLWEWRATTAVGKRITASARTQAEAKRRCLEKLRPADKGIVVAGNRQTVKTYLAWWLEGV